MTSDELIDGLERPARWWWSDHPKGQRKFVSTIPQQAADQIRELEARMKWQPIETAPKDGTPVLLWGLWCGEINGPDDKPTGPYVGKFSDGRSDYGSEGWWDLDGGDAYMTWCKPTHWMPLPEPPQEKADEGKG